MKKLFLVLSAFTFIFCFSCKSSAAKPDDLKKSDGAEVSKIIETEPLPVEELNEPQISDETEILIAGDDSPEFEEITEPEEEIVIAEPEPVIIEDEITLPEPVVSAAPPEKKELPAIPQVQPPSVVSQIPVRPAPENVPPPSAPVEEPLQIINEPVEEKPVERNTTVSALKNEPVVPPQSLPVIPPNGEIIYSRTIRATAGQMIEIPFRGTGWVYLGELASRRGISYDSRRLDPEGQSFIFRAAEEGTYSLKFFKQDFIRDYILNDHVMVIVGQAPTANTGWFNPPQDRGRVTAQPRWPATLEEAEMRRGGVSANADNEKAADTTGLNSSERREQGTVVIPLPQLKESENQNGTSPQSPNQRQEPQNVTSRDNGKSVSSLNANENLKNDQNAAEETPSAFNGDSGELLQKAKEAFDGGNVQTAISFLDQYKYFFPSGSDEAYWLYGQFLEANTPSRNILLALDYYKRLTNEYPQSSRYNDARRRIQYLERFYININ